MNDQSFQFIFTTSKKADEVFAVLSDPRKWWMGVFGETIEGTSGQVNDEFSFKAGEGAHYSNQKLIELNTDKSITWLVTESNLSFLSKADEWTGTKIGFYILDEGDQRRVTFYHKGLLPEIECYEACSSGWTRYMKNLEKALN